MSVTKYIVEIDLRTVGSTDFGAKTSERTAVSLERASAYAGKFTTHLRAAGSAAAGLYGQVIGVADRVAGAAFTMGKWAAFGAVGAGIAATTYGVMGLNNQLEKTTISLGAIFKAQGASPTLPAGLRLAENTIAKMREDAAKLPGEFSDLINIFTTASIPGLQSGASVKEFADLSARVMAAGVVASMPLDQVGREFAMLLQGRSGAHNVFGMRLLGLAGDAAETFNKKAAPERLSIISKELDKYGDALDEFGKSFEGRFTTAIDAGKNLLRIGTAPLFERAKDSFGSITAWLLSGNAEQVARNVGARLADGFEWAKEKIAEWWPAIQAFGENAFVRITQIWEDAQPYVERFGTALQTALKDPGTIDKLITLLKLYVAAKVGGAAIGVGANLLGVGTNLALAGKAAGFFGGGAVATAGGAAASGVAATGGVAGAGATAAGAAGAGTVGAAGAGVAASTAGTGLLAGGGVAGLATTAGSIAGALVGVGAAAFQLNELRKDIASGWKPGMSLLEAGRNMSEERRASNRNWQMPEILGGGILVDEGDRRAIAEWASREIDARYSTVEGMDYMRDRLEALASIAETSSDPLARLREEYYSNAVAAADARRAVEGLADGVGVAADSIMASIGIMNGTMGGMLGEAGDVIRGLHAQYLPKGGEGAKGTARHGGGGGGTNIQKVEIVVTSNQDPSRIARVVADELGKVAKHRGSSRYAPNYSRSPT